MAAKDFNDERDFPHSHRHSPRRGRGRGRGHYTISNADRILYHLGVRDLREHLDRKRNELSNSDDTPLEITNDSECSKQEPGDFSSPQLQQKVRSKTFVNSRKDGGPRGKDIANSEPRGKDIANPGPRGKNIENPGPRGKDIENPLNIKVEFSTSTGKHTYMVDENTVLPTIKHVPDQFLESNRGFRGRGRGRGRRGARGRGRGGRVTNRYPAKTSPDGLPPTVQSDENWDYDCNDNQPIEAVQDLAATTVEHADGEYQDAEEYEANIEEEIKALNINDTK